MVGASPDKTPRHEEKATHDRSLIVVRKSLHSEKSQSRRANPPTQYSESNEALPSDFEEGPRGVNYRLGYMPSPFHG